MIKTAVVGGTGYTGVELLRLLAGHPGVELAVITSRGEAGRPVAELFPNLRGCLDLAFSAPDVAALKSCDLVFFATPNGTAMAMVPELLEAGVRVIDLAADFRLRRPDVWERWYGMQHACPELLEEAVYGLPEMNRAAIRSARLVANPGCYPTAVTLGWLPLIKAGLVDSSDLIADAKSGVSGAGRGANVGTLFSEAGDSFKAYGVAGHRHHPEIAQTLTQLSGKQTGLLFTPHLTPMIRGIHATLYAKLLPGIDVDLQTHYEEVYAEEAFVDVMPAGSTPETRSVRGSNICRVALYRNEQSIIVLSVIDNLVKGAAGQAIQNFNLMFGYDEKTGLDLVPLAP